MKEDYTSRNFATNNQPNYDPCQFELLHGRGTHQETLTNLGNLYYTRINDLEREKSKSSPDQGMISRLERIIAELQKYQQYATRHKKQTTR